MKLPRDISGADLVQSLKKIGYKVTRQTGSHIRLTTQQKGEHHLTIPNHSVIRIGTLAPILTDVADHFQLSRNELIEKLYIH